MHATLSVQRIANTIAENEPALRGDLIAAIETYCDVFDIDEHHTLSPTQVQRLVHLHQLLHALGA